MDRESCVVRFGGIADFIEDIEFVFRPDQHLIGDAKFLHIGKGTLRHISRILVKRPVLRAVYDHDVADHGKCFDRCICVDHGGIQDRNKNHVTVLDGGIPIIGTVKTDAADHRVFRQTLCRNRQVAPSAIDVCQFKVDHLDIVVFTHLQNIVQTFGHTKPSLTFSFSQSPRPAGGAHAQLSEPW